MATPQTSNPTEWLKLLAVTVDPKSRGLQVHPASPDATLLGGMHVA
ncbi:MAG TPA: hypothetical protein PKA88_14920 [Polyangiaceae bacterium]|nr:hypothetical protein [Polyangiaceae bacterium]